MTDWRTGERKKAMQIQVLRLVGTLLFGIFGGQWILPQAGASAAPAESVWSGVRVAPAPQAFSPSETGRLLPAAPTGIASFQRELGAIGRERLLVVHGIVVGLSAKRTTIPEQIWPESEEQVVTDVTIAIQHIVCGSYGGREVIGRYVGGTIPGVSSSYNSLMPSDPTIGRDYTFALQQIDSVHFITNGRFSMLLVNDAEHYSDADGNRISRDDLVKSCP